jgi:hypothetical protein
MAISGDEPKGGAGLMKVLLVSAAAIVAAETLTAADTALKKAPPVQYVRVCDIYGAGFFQLPGTVFCGALRGQLQVDTNLEAGKDAVFVQQDSKKNGDSYFVNVVPAGAQDESGWQVQAKPTFASAPRRHSHPARSHSAALHPQPGYFPSGSGV